MTLYKTKDIRKKERFLAIWRYHYPLYKLILGLWFDAFHGIQNFLGQWSVTVYWHNVNTDMLQYKFLHCSAWFITVESKQFICDMVKTLNWVRNGDTKYIVIGSHTSKNVWQKQKKSSKYNNNTKNHWPPTQRHTFNKYNPLQCHSSQINP